MSIEDRMAIRKLNLQYAFYIDTGEVDQWVDTFAADGVFDERECNYGLHVGHDQIRSHGRNIVAGAAQVVHLMFNHLITDLTASTASGTVSGLAEGVSRTGERHRFHVAYEDEYVKTAEEWKLGRRVVRPRMPPEAVVQFNLAS